MKPNQLRTLCETLCAGNVSKFAELVGITRTAYYRSVKSDTVHELTAHKVQARLHDMQVNADRLTQIEARLDALEFITERPEKRTGVTP